MTPVPSSPVALLDQLDELRAKATPGPWAQHSADHEYVIGEVGEDEDGNLSYLDVADCYGYRSQRGTANAALIVAAVNAVGPLTDAVRAVLALADQWAALEHWDYRGPEKLARARADSANDAARILRDRITAALSVTP